jgi:hypothetical protein
LFAWLCFGNLSRWLHGYTLAELRIAATLLANDGSFESSSIK